MENTIENKAKFFAQYWGQDIMIYVTPDSNKEYKVKISSFIRTESIEDCFLQLKSLSQITDEDLKECDFNFSKGVSIDFKGFYWKGYDSNGFFLAEGLLTPKNVDYLRQKGYALPWMDLSVKEQEKYGWIKLQDHE